MVNEQRPEGREPKPLSNEPLIRLGLVVGALVVGIGGTIALNQISEGDKAIAGTIQCPPTEDFVGAKVSYDGNSGEVDWMQRPGYSKVEFGFSFGTGQVTAYSLEVSCGANPANPDKPLHIDYTPQQEIGARVLEIACTDQADDPTGTCTVTAPIKPVLTKQ